MFITLKGQITARNFRASDFFLSNPLITNGKEICVQNFNFESIDLATKVHKCYFGINKAKPVHLKIYFNMAKEKEHCTDFFYVKSCRKVFIVSLGHCNVQFRGQTKVN